MAENDAPNQLEDEDEGPLVVPSHAPLPPPPEVYYTRPTLGQKSSVCREYMRTRILSGSRVTWKVKARLVMELV